MQLVQNRTIPEFRVLDGTANVLKSHLSDKTSKPVVLKVDLSILHPDNRVEYDLWYSTGLDVSTKVLKGIIAYQNIFGSNALFTPRIMTFSCDNCPDYIKKRDCLSDGKYCPFMPMHEGFGYGKFNFHKYKFNGRVLLMEALKEKCAYDLAMKHKGLGDWYGYFYNIRNKIIEEEGTRDNFDEFT